MTFKAFGINFKISYIFSFCIVIFIAADKTGNILPILFSTLIHETGHLIAMKIFKAYPSEISLNLGTIRILNNAIVTNNENLLILLFGPLANLAFFLIFINIESFKLFAIINLALFIFNLLPIEGLDGGSILKLALRFRFSEQKVDRILFIITLLFAAALIFVFVFLLFGGRLNFSIPILFLYLTLPLIIKKIS